MASIELPFLYQTRTILGQSRSFATSSQRLLRQRPGVSFSVPTKSTAPTKSESFFRQKANTAESAPVKAVKRSTITGQEQQTFNKIFKDITKRKSGDDNHEVVDRFEIDTNQERILDMFSNSIKEHQNEQQKKTGPEASRPIDGSEDGQLAPPAKDYVSRYPEVLQRAARRATKAATEGQDVYPECSGEPVPIRYTPLKPDVVLQKRTKFEEDKRSEALDASLRAQRFDDSAFTRPTFLQELFHAENTPFTVPSGTIRPTFLRRTKTEEGSEPESQETSSEDFEKIVHAVAKREMAKIDRAFNVLMADGKAIDLAIWEVCQQRIFPMLNNLELDDVSRMQQTDESTTKESNLGLNRAQLTPLEGPDKENMVKWRWARLPAYIPPLSIVSRLYPASLLLALRLLAKHSPTSPFALAVLPEVRARGLSSHVLGGSPQLYNTLVKLQWDVYSDLSEINRLLTEMEKGGIELDAGTYNILVAITEERWKDMVREDADIPKGARSKSWWERPEQVKWFQKVCVEWKQIIAARLREQGQLASEREYGSSLLEPVPANHDEGRNGQKTVWIG